MNQISFARAALSAFLVPAIILSASPAFAAKGKTALPKAPILTCTTQAANGLTYTVIKPGKGDRPGADSKVKVNYTGRLRSDGTQFDAGQGTEFKVGGVVPGFGQGLQLMQAGGNYRLCIPATLGYGEEGNGPVPAGADMVFEVSLLSFSTPPPKPAIPVAERTCDKVTTSGLGYTIIKEGAGAMPTDKDVALVDFQTFDAKTGEILEKREWEKIPLAQTTKMFGEALRMMQAGAAYRFCMSAKEAISGAPVVNIRVDMIAIRPSQVED